MSRVQLIETPLWTRLVIKTRITNEKLYRARSNLRTRAKTERRRRSRPFRDFDNCLKSWPIIRSLTRLWEEIRRVGESFACSRIRRNRSTAAATDRYSSKIDEYKIRELRREGTGSSLTNPGVNETLLSTNTTVTPVFSTSSRRIFFFSKLLLFASNRNISRAAELRGNPRGFDSMSYITLKGIDKFHKVRSKSGHAFEYLQLWKVSTRNIY